LDQQLNSNRVEDHSTEALTGRRKFVLLGLGGVAVLGLEACGGAAASAASSTTTSSSSSGSTCTLAAELTEGPFYVDDGLLRSDLLEGQTGVPLRLKITVVKASTCAAVSGAVVEVWCANHTGTYSDESSEGTLGETYLRGTQITDSDGLVAFTMIYPGWYSGRTVHIHLRVRTGGTASGSTYSTSGSTIVHTGQLFFPASYNEAMRSVYAEDTNSFINNDSDSIYASGGSSSILTLTGSTAAGFTGTITVAVAIS